MPHSSLLVCPKNLKECIDWVLRATGKDKTGQDNIVKLKDALKAELKGSGLTGDLTQLNALASGLGFLAGLPACLCKTKKSVKEGLKKIYEELKTPLISCNSQLNCDSCSNGVPCKCCVIQSIKAVKKCGCLQTPKTPCHCNGQKVSCNKVLAGLEACLHLQCLQSDMEDICKCDPEKCCKSGTCTQASVGSGGSCKFCQKLKPGKTPVPTTGLGLSPPNPIRLAQRLEKFFGSSGRKDPCGCNGSPCTCCCLACQDCSSKKSCFCSNSPCSCASKLKLQPSQCPRKKFCMAIQNVKLLADSSEMACCEGGKKCHCQLPGSGSKCNSGQCCVVEDKSGTGSNNHYQHSVKCMIRRVVKFFKDLSLDSSQSGCPKLCCELLCVLKICEFLKTFYNKRNKKCSKCTSKGPCNGSTLKSGKGGPCCGGKPSNCVKDPNCCLGCLDCSAIKFSRALQKLQYSGPCGQDLYRLLKDLLNFCSNVMHPNQDFIRDTVLAAVKGCDKCNKKDPKNSSEWQACDCSKSGSSSCQACTSLLKDSKLMSILRHGYVSSYTYKFLSSFDTHINATSASWKYLCASGSKCCSNPSCSKCQDCSSSGSCDPSQCCPDCPQRKAAKIFLGMLPCMYWGLKILHDRAQDPVTWPDWQKISVDSKGLPSSDLGRFLYAWGYDVRPLISKKGSEFFPLLDSLSTLKVLESLSTLVTDKYFTSHLISPSPNSSPPT
ncbi:variant erythrocyte surface antigen-1, beta subunit, partial [Babesia divergens]